MKIKVNGETKNTNSKTILELLDELGIEEKVMAAAINLDVVKKEHWQTHPINEGDKIEFLQFVGGG